jgi:hypothetical protein
LLSSAHCSPSRTQLNHLVASGIKSRGFDIKHPALNWTQSALWLQSRSKSAEQKPFCMKVTGRDMRDRKDVAMT